MPYPALRMVEHAVDSIATLLRASFNQHLKYVWSEHSDVVGIGGVNLPIVEENAYYYTDTIEPKFLPAIFILVDRTHHVLRAQNWAYQEQIIFVAVLYEDKEYDWLQRKGWRYAEALFRSIHDKGFGNCRFVIEEVTYNPTLAYSGDKETRQFRKNVLVKVRVFNLEPFPGTY